MVDVMRVQNRETKKTLLRTNNRVLSDIKDAEQVKLKILTRDGDHMTFLLASLGDKPAHGKEVEVSLMVAKADFQSLLEKDQMIIFEHDCKVAGFIVQHMYREPMFCKRELLVEDVMKKVYN